MRKIKKQSNYIQFIKDMLHKKNKQRQIMKASRHNPNQDHLDNGYLVIPTKKEKFTADIWSHANEGF